MKKKKIKNDPEKQLELLKNKYGTNLNFVDVTLPLTFSEVKSYFGPECKKYDHLCGCCNAWKQFHTNNQMVTIALERKDIIKIISK